MIQIELEEKVYVVGAAGFWLERGATSDHDREKRICAAIDRKFRKRIEYEGQRIAQIGKALDARTAN